MKYIGQHRISGNPKLDNNYFGSGTRITFAINNIGIDNFEKIILEECNSEDELNDRERYWIKYYNAVKDPMFYNIAEGGEFGDTWSGKTDNEKKAFSQIIALSNKKRKRDISKICGDKNPAFGRHWYKDIVNKCQYYLFPNDPLIDKLKLERGMFRTKEHNEKIGNSNRGKKKNYQVFANNCRWMHLKGSNKKEDRIFIKESNCQKYLDLGYVFGMKD